MKKIFLYATLFFASCATKKNQSDYSAEIIKADNAMSELAQKEGFNLALSTFADTDFVKLNDGNFPIIGKKNFDQSFENSGTKLISWAPIKAEVSISGDLGYTWGNWVFKQNDTSSIYGNYFTVWKKQNSGEWKIVLDGGNTTPNPNK